MEKENQVELVSPLLGFMISPTIFPLPSFHYLQFDFAENSYPTILGIGIVTRVGLPFLKICMVITFKFNSHYFSQFGFPSQLLTLSVKAMAVAQVSASLSVSIRG